jgi:predicted transcriptional regulator
MTGLKIIDGTPTAISKYLREKECKEEIIEELIKPENQEVIKRNEIKYISGEKEMFSPCCINSLAKLIGINRFQCVKCRKIWRIEEK